MSATTFLKLFEGRCQVFNSEGVRIEWRPVTREDYIPPEDVGEDDPLTYTLVAGVENEGGPKGTGAGTRAMQAFMAQHPEGLVLQAYPLDMTGPGFDANQKRLVQWYERLGFKHTACGWLHRPPLR